MEVNAKQTVEFCAVRKRNFTTAAAAAAAAAAASGATLDCARDGCSSIRVMLLMLDGKFRVLMLLPVFHSSMNSDCITLMIPTTNITNTTAAAATTTIQTASSSSSSIKIASQHLQMALRKL
jgi:hypothetical protein